MLCPEMKCYGDSSAPVTFCLSLFSLRSQNTFPGKPQLIFFPGPLFCTEPHVHLTPVDLLIPVAELQWEGWISIFGILLENVGVNKHYNFV